MVAMVKPTAPRLYLVQFDGQQDYVEAATIGEAAKVWMAAMRIERELDGDEEPESCALVHDGPAIRLPSPSDAQGRLICTEIVVEQIKEQLNIACAIIELGDQRLLAGDGPAGGQPPELSLAEWRKLYSTLDHARKIGVFTLSA
jgi:hypothetical protein